MHKKIRFNLQITVLQNDWKWKVQSVDFNLFHAKIKLKWDLFMLTQICFLNFILQFLYLSFMLWPQSLKSDNVFKYLTSFLMHSHNVISMCIIKNMSCSDHHEEVKTAIEDSLWFGIFTQITAQSLTQRVRLEEYVTDCIMQILVNFKHLTWCRKF